MARNKLLYRGAIALALLFWASGNVASRIAVQYFSAEQLTIFRLLAAALFIDVVAISRGVRAPAKRDLPLFFLMGGCGFALYMLFINLGVRSIAATTLSFILATIPLFTALAAGLLLREKMSTRGWICSFISLSGVALITLYGDGLALNTGACWIIGAVVLLSLYYVMIRRLSGRYSSLEITVYCLNAGALLLIWNLPSLAEALRGGVSWQPLAAACWLGLLTTGGAYFCWAYAIQKTADINRLNMFIYLTSPLTIVLSLLILDETVPVSSYIGGLLILGGLLLRNLLDKPERTAASEVAGDG